MPKRGNVVVLDKGKGELEQELSPIRRSGTKSYPSVYSALFALLVLLLHPAVLTGAPHCSTVCLHGGPMMHEPRINRTANMAKFPQPDLRT